MGLQHVCGGGLVLADIALAAARGPRLALKDQENMFKQWATGVPSAQRQGDSVRGDRAASGMRASCCLAACAAGQRAPTTSMHEGWAGIAVGQAVGHRHGGGAGIGSMADWLAGWLVGWPS